MALNVDTVYKTVLLIMNKEQRGYVTPDEFNKIATQVQLQIFENYFEDYTQQLRTPQNTSEYSERLKELDNKISIFKTTATVQLTYTYQWELHWLFSRTNIIRFNACFNLHKHLFINLVLLYIKTD
jgi:hypothetical protein